jgi:heavy metal sensor kinase
MKSIRLSLVVYFLVLLTVALGTASVLAYRSAQKALEEKKESMEARIKGEYEERRTKEIARLDQDLLHQAEILAQLASLQIDWPRYRFPFHWGRVHRERRGPMDVPHPEPDLHLPDLHVLGILTTTPSPYGHFSSLGWIAETNRQLSNPEWLKTLRGDLNLDTNQLQQNVNEKIAEYYQLDGFWVWGATYRSKSLGERSFPFDPETFAVDQVVHYEIADYRLDADTTVRRVILKVSGAKVVAPPEPRDQRPPGPPGGPPPGGVSPAGGRQRPAIYVQCAYDVRKLEAALQVFADRRDEDLASLTTETNASLASLRNFLLGMSAAIFAASVIGSFFLVRLGLSPLRRLSDAVSRVSARDFRLQMNQRRLPGELKPIVERLTETLDQLKRAFTREKKATADISHELRTPLAALLTTTELALRKSRSAEEYREFLQDCRLSGQQMNQAVERLLTLARLDAGVEVIRPKDVDASQLAEQCAAVVRPLAEARGLHLNVHRNGDTYLSADPDKLREVLTNLLHNAIQYNRPDGDIDLTVARVNGSVNLEVRDTGIGIPPEAREQIFERFYRADPSRGTDGLHTGLGLAIVKEYVGLMGGTIAVESTEGQGSTFRVQLPAQSFPR